MLWNSPHKTVFIRQGNVCIKQRKLIRLSNILYIIDTGTTIQQQYADNMQHTIQVYMLQLTTL